MFVDHFWLTVIAAVVCVILVYEGFKALVRWLMRGGH